MLKSLKIQNYALIQDLHIKPSENLNIITGETGAGKSIMLGALGLLLGNRADKKVLYFDDKKCIVEATFDIREYKLQELFELLEMDYDDETIIRREIAPSGKSRGFINDQPATLDLLKTITPRLIDIHSQHDNLLLGDSTFQLNLIDQFALNSDLKRQVQESFTTYQSRKRHLESLQKKADSLRDEYEFNQFQFEELDKASLVNGELTELESELAVLENSEEVKTALSESIHIMEEETYGISTQLTEIKRKLSGIGPLSQTYQTLHNRVESALIELMDVQKEMTDLNDKTEHDPIRIDEVNERIRLINNLLQKHRKSDISELIELKNELNQNLELVGNLDDELEKAKNEVNESYNVVLSLCESLSQSRTNVFQTVAEQVITIIRELGMPEGLFEIDIKKGEITENGFDEISFLFSANKGVEPRNLMEVASGGEFSRLMFALKAILAKKAAMPTLIFDEIETGVSGEVAKKMAGQLKLMSENIQIVSISHLPQFAAQGDSHYFVYKDHSSEKSVSLVKKLAREERVKEIAQMIDGENPSKTALASAEELLG